MPSSASSSRATHPLHVFQDSLVIKPFSPTKRFFISACRSVAVIVFWGLLALIAGRILLPAVFKNRRQAAELTVRTGGQNGTAPAVVLSAAGQQALEAISTCDLSTEGECPFAGIASSRFTAGELSAQVQRITETQDSLNNLIKSVDALQSDTSADHAKAIKQLEKVEATLRSELAQAVETLAARVGSLETWRAGPAAAVETQVAALAKDTAELQETAATQQQLQQVQDEATAATSGVAGLTKQVEALGTKNTELEQAAAGAQSAADKAQATADAASTEATAAAAAAQATEAEVAQLRESVSAAADAVAAGPSEDAIAAAVKDAADAATAAAAGPAVKDAVAAATADIHEGVAAVLQAALEAPDLKTKINEAVQKAALQHATALAEGEVGDDGSVRTALTDAVQRHLASALEQPQVAQAMQEHVESAKNTALEASASSAQDALAQKVQDAQAAAVSDALSAVDEQVAKQVAEKVAAAQASALESALDTDAIDAMVASAVAAAVQQKVDTAATAADAALGDAKEASLLQLQSAADELILQLRAEKDALQAAKEQAAAPVAAAPAGLTLVPGTAVALQYPPNVASAAQGAMVALGEEHTSGSDMLARLTALVDECSELHPVPPSGKASPIQSMLLAKTTGHAASAGTVAAASGTAARMAACAEAQQALTAYGTEGAKNNRNPQWLLHPSRPQPGQAWLVEKPSTKATLQLPKATTLTRIGVLAPTVFQRGGQDAPQCRPTAISAVCVLDNAPPAMLLSETELNWNTEQDEAGEAFVEVAGAMPCGRVLVTVRSAGPQVCLHRVVLQE